jgi:hypothetical protein
MGRGGTMEGIAAFLGVVERLSKLLELRKERDRKRFDRVIKDMVPVA